MKMVYDSVLDRMRRDYQKPNALRDATIVSNYRSGVSAQALADRHGLTSVRIWQIVHKVELYEPEWWELGG